MNVQSQRKNAYQILSTNKLYKGPEEHFFHYSVMWTQLLSTWVQVAKGLRHFSHSPDPHGRVNRATEVPTSDLMTSGSRLKLQCGGPSILITSDKLSDEASVTTPWGTFVLYVSEENSFLGQRQFLLLSQRLKRSDSSHK